MLASGGDSSGSLCRHSEGLVRDLLRGMLQHELSQHQSSGRWQGLDTDLDADFDVDLDVGANAATSPMQDGRYVWVKDWDSVPQA